MALEIERKFLVVGEAWRTTPGSFLRQGYLNRDPQRTIRIRVSGDSAWICVKGISKGAARAEFEYQIPRDDGVAMLALCESSLVEKTRYRLSYAGRCWQIDEFHGDNAGLLMAEVELEHENEPVDLPPWIGAEVTHDPRYYNANLAAFPYRQWVL